MNSTLLSPAHLVITRHGHCFPWEESSFIRYFLSFIYLGDAHSLATQLPLAGFLHAFIDDFYLLTPIIRRKLAPRRHTKVF